MCAKGCACSEHLSWFLLVCRQSSNVQSQLYGLPELAATVCPLGDALLTPSLPLHFPSHESESPEQTQSKGWLRFDKFYKVH